MMSDGSGGSAVNSGVMRSNVPATRTVTRYVCLGTLTRVSASTSKNGSMRDGLLKSIVPRLTTYRLPSKSTVPRSISARPKSSGRS